MKDQKLKNSIRRKSNSKNRLSFQNLTPIDRSMLTNLFFFCSSKSNVIDEFDSVRNEISYKAIKLIPKNIRIYSLC